MILDEDRKEEYRHLLHERRLALTGMAESLKSHGLEETQGESLSELSTYDNHPADIGTETWERSKDLALRRQLRQHLALVDRALVKLDAGDFGTCRACGREVGRDRLQALPEAEFCRDCQGALSREEDARQRRRPIEEEVLSPPFGRTFTDDDREGGGVRGGDGNVGYDGEDAWQEVALYGTSETPQDVPDSAGYDRLYQDAYERRGGVTDLENIVDEKGEPLHDREQEGKGRGRTGRGSE